MEKMSEMFITTMIFAVIFASEIFTLDFLSTNLLFKYSRNNLKNNS